MLASAICGVNNATGEARYGAPPVSTRTHFQFKYRAFLSRSHLTSAIRFHLLSRRGALLYSCARASATEAHRLRLRELSNELITSRVLPPPPRIWDAGTNGTHRGLRERRGRREDGGGDGAGSFLVWSINGCTLIRECINKFGVINSCIIPRGREASLANFASRSRVRNSFASDVFREYHVHDATYMHATFSGGVSYQGIPANAHLLTRGRCARRVGDVAL